MVSSLAYGIICRGTEIYKTVELGMLLKGCRKSFLRISFMLHFGSNAFVFYIVCLLSCPVPTLQVF